MENVMDKLFSLLHVKYISFCFIKALDSKRILNGMS